jgi:putative Ca2+/H+ antiporter (TMEM165/GDT1 family)
MGFAGIAVGVGYLLWYGMSISWMGCAAAFAASALCVSVGASLERYLGTLTVQIGSAVLWPMFAVLMLWTLMTASK